MSKIQWDTPEQKLFESGLDHGVIYFSSFDGYSDGVAWNGLSSIETPVVNDEGTGLFRGAYKETNEYSPTDYTGTIEAYTYPDEFSRCLGDSEALSGIVISGQGIEPFGLSYRTLINGHDGSEINYKIHLIYNIRINGFTKTSSTLTDSFDVEPFSWDYESFPVFMEDYGIDGYEPIYHIAIDPSNCTKSYLKHLEDVLYGTSDTIPRLPMPDEILNDYYQYFDEWVGYPASMIYPKRYIYPLDAQGGE